MKRTRPIQSTIETLGITAFFMFGFFFAGTLYPFVNTVCLPGTINVAANVLTQSGGNNVLRTFMGITSPIDTLYSVMPVSLQPEKEAETVYHEPPAPEKVREISLNTPKSRSISGVSVINDSGYDINIEEVLSAPLNLGDSKPDILIVHTHTSESYTPSEKYDYLQSDPYRTEDPNFNVTLVGEKLAKTLENSGIKVVHDKTSHDYPSYNGSYKRSLETVTSNINMNPNLKIVLDIHRDAISDGDGYYKTVSGGSGSPCAQAMIVVGTDKSGLEHPNWRENFSLAVHMQKYISSKYDTLMRPIHLREERFNAHLSGGALIIEIGSCGNTMEEALLCAGRVGEGIAQMLGELYTN